MCICICTHATRQYDRTARDHFASIGTVLSLEFASISLPFVRPKLHQRAHNAFVALFTSVICVVSTYFSFSSVLFLALNRSMPYNVQRTKKGSRTEIYHLRTAGYHLESGFFGAVTEQKESARNRLVVFALMAATCGRWVESERK